MVVYWFYGAIVLALALVGFLAFRDRQRRRKANQPMADSIHAAGRGATRHSTADMPRASGDVAGISAGDSGS